MPARRLFPLLSMVVCLFALSFTGWAQEEGDLPYLQLAECPFEMPEGETEGETLYCGILTTYEDHFDDADEALVEIAFVILGTVAEEPARDAVIYLEGGPGGSAILSLEDWAESSIREYHDLILVDQRGMGFSYPNLNCVEVEEYDGDDSFEGEQACYERLVDEGINLDAYNSVQSATDIAELMSLLIEDVGYTEFNLLGISYGTRLALTLMRDHPENIRSVILDSVYPPNENAYEMQAAYNYRGLVMLFDGCNADPDCVEAFPDLESVFYDTYVSLNGTPGTYESEDEETGEISEEELTGDEFLDLIIESLYSTDAIPELPLVIYEVSEGNYDIVNLIDTGELSGGFQRAPLRQDETEGDISDSEGAFNAIECKEELPFNDFNAAVEMTAEVPDPIHDFMLATIENQFRICELYGLKPADDIENEAVSSDIPTLVLAGDYDPITPPSSAQLAAETLSRSYYFEFPGYGHGITDNGDCAVSIIAEFLADPTIEPDGSCIDEIEPPAFVTR